MPSPYYRPNLYNEDNPDPRAEGAYGLSTVRQFPTNLIQKLTMGAIQLGRNIVGAPAPMVFGGAGTNGLTPPPGAANPTGGIAMDANYGTGGEGTSMILPGSAGNPPQIAPPPTPDKGPWFGPGTPLSPMAPPADVAGREFDYPNSYNIGNTPRQYEAISFWQLRQVADLYTIVRILIEACKDQMETVTGSFLPMQVPGETNRKAPDARCQQLENFFKYPDGRTPYNTWKRELLEEMYVIDAPAMYVRRDMMNRPARLEIMKGDYIMPLIDTTGRVPEPPMVAFKQITKGVPAIYYRADELIYWPRNRRAGHVYATSPLSK